MMVLEETFTLRIYCYKLDAMKEDNYLIIKDLTI